MNSKKEVILIYPGKHIESKPQQGLASIVHRYLPKHPIRPPLSLLPIAAYLRQAGFLPTIVDCRVTEYRHIDYSQAIFVGISTMTIGNMISHGLAVAEFVRQQSPATPIVWGGIHPTLTAESTIQQDLVDVVVRGEGEETSVELANAFLSKNPLHSIKGITFIEKGEPLHTPDRLFINMNDIPPIPYDLLNKSNYPAAQENFIYQSSRGCPHNCIFCYNKPYNRRRYRTRSAKNVLKDIALIQKEFSPRILQFFDDEFFTNKKRVIEICTGMIEQKMNMQWMAGCRLDYIDSYGDEFLGLIARSGCTSLGVGGESGSERILSYINKGVSLSQMKGAVAKLRKYDIEALLSFVVGLPGETWRDIKKTLQFIDKLKSIHPKVIVNSINVLVPLPGAPIFEEVQKLGYHPPQTLEEWAQFSWADKNHTPWHTPKYSRKLETLYTISRFLFIANHPLLQRAHPCIRFFIKQLSALGAFRMKRGWLFFPIEWDLFKLFQKVVVDYF